MIKLNINDLRKIKAEVLVTQEYRLDSLLIQ